MRWTLTGVLSSAALLNGYLAASEEVLWPVPLALLWIAVAATVATAEREAPALRRVDRRAPQRGGALAEQLG